MRIVLLGATGFVGHHLLPQLTAAGHRCLVLSRYAMACRELSVIPGVEIRQTDVYDAERLAACFHGADAVVNMVGILNESGRNGKGFHRAHVELTERVIAACRAEGVRRSRPRLEQANAYRRVLTQPVGQCATGRTRTDYDVVELILPAEARIGCICDDISRGPVHRAVGRTGDADDVG